MTLNNFYQRPDGSQDSARVTCDLDPSLGSAPIVPCQQQALLTTDPTTAGSVGQVVTGYGAGNSLRVTGPVHSNSAISLVNGNLMASGPITARQTCLQCSGRVQPRGVRATTGTG